MRSVRGTCAIALTMLFAACSNIFDADICYSENPVIVTYDGERAAAVQATWQEFVRVNGIILDSVSVSYHDITSLVQSIQFYSPLSFYNGTLTQADTILIKNRLLAFYNSWADLFSGERNNIELRYFWFYPDGSGEAHFYQSAMNGIPIYAYSNNRFSVYFTPQGGITRIT